MTTIHDLPTPALLVDLDRVESNLRAMAARTAGLGVRLRPHVKTHKCVEVGAMQRAAGASGITVSTLYEGEVFATAGFEDILWAFPVIPSRIAQAAELARRVQLGVVVDCDAAVDALEAHGHPFRVWIKVDCGYHRAGVNPDALAPEQVAARVVAAGLELVGLLSHSGNAYDSVGTSARAALAEQERARIVEVASRLREAGHAVPEVSVGSTPGMTAARSLDGVTEARPGNYAYFDRTQVSLESCTLQDCAVTVLSTVVSSSASHAVIDAGALALSMDAVPAGSMGEVYADYESGRLETDLRVASLSQEHGKLSRSLPYGSQVRIVPNHSCLTVACFDHCHAVRGEQVVDRWRVWNGR